MPVREPTFWEIIMTSMTAPVLAFITAYFRAMYDGKSMAGRLVEGSLLGLATVAVKPVLIWWGLPVDLAIFLGVLFGFVGVETLKCWIKRAADSRFPKDTE